MRIHTDATMVDVLSAIGSVPTVRATVLREHKSSTHRHAFELQLSGSSPSRQNNGGNEYAASWDEWGVVMAAIFAADPYTRMGGNVKRPVYASKADFHWQTNWRFDGGMPTDTHPRHKWEVEIPYQAECTKCTAVRNWQ